MTLEEIEKEIYRYDDNCKAQMVKRESLDWLISRVKELEEGIRKHRDLRKGWNIKFWKEDDDLYKLVE